MDKDYYKILGVSADADPKAIKDGFRHLAFQYHPDRNEGNPEAADRMKAVNEAYAVLSNPQKRREYDTLRTRFGSSARNQFRQNYSDQDIFSGSDVNQILEELAKNFGLRGFEDIFREIYGQGYRNFEFKGPGGFVTGFFFAGPLFSKGKGGKGLNGSVSRDVLGNLSQYLLKKVTGIEIPSTGDDFEETIYVDEETAEKGGPYAFFHKEQKKKLVVKIPPGVREGQRIRLAGMGRGGKAGGDPGDLYLKVVIEKPLMGKIKRFISGLTR